MNFVWVKMTYFTFWRDHCKFSMVFEETITIECFLGGLTIAINGFKMVFWCCYHRCQWFSMVLDHWSNDAMVSMDRCGLVYIDSILWEKTYIKYQNFRICLKKWSCFFRYTPNMYLSFYWLAMANSCVNPIVYYWMNKRYIRIILAYSNGFELLWMEFFMIQLKKKS